MQKVRYEQERQIYFIKIIKTTFCNKKKIKKKTKKKKDDKCMFILLYYICMLQLEIDGEEQHEDVMRS